MGRRVPSRGAIVNLCNQALALAFFITILYAGSIEAEEAISPTNRIRLFNGRDLTGFYPWLVDTKREDPRQVFAVTNGWIRISGDGLGYLSTEKSYENYRLVAEFKWGQRNYTWGDRIGKARDSGIFLHSTGPDGNSHDGKGAFKAAIECNIFQGAVGDFLLIRGTNFDGTILAPRLLAQVDRPGENSHRWASPRLDREGWPYWRAGFRRMMIERWGRVNWFGKDANWRDAVDFRGSNDVERVHGEWNRIECLAQGEDLRIVLNGTVVNEASGVWPSQGKILLQCEGSEIFFRRLELHPRRNRAR